MTSNSIDNFYSLLRWLERYQNSSLEDLKIIASIDLAFPCADIYSIENTKIITQNLLGLAGQNGILPDHITKDLLNAIEQKDFALRDFLDIFNSKILKLYYQAWSSSQFYIAYENASSHQDYTLGILKGISGCNYPGLPTAFDDLIIYYSRILSHKIKTKEGLTILLQTYFSLPIAIEEHLGHWLKISDSEVTQLNQQCNQLGKTTILGARFWYSQNRFKIIIGMIDYTEFLEFLPNKNKIKMFRELVKLYCGLDYFFEIDFKVNPQTIPAIQLGSISKNKFYLGWNTWL